MSTELTVIDACRPESPDDERSGNHLDRYHSSVLLGAACILLLAFLLRVRPDQRVELFLLPDLPLPELCQSRVLFGWNCPGCGLTRSFVHLADGDVRASVAVNRVGWLFAVVVMLQFPYRVWALRSADGRPLGRSLPWLFFWIPFTLLVANWLVMLATLLS